MTEKPSVSVVLTVRNEYPIILSTIYSVYEELTLWGYDFEIIVVDNLSDDNGPDVLEDRFRRWVRSGLLRVIRYNERAGNVIVRNVGVRAAGGDVVLVGDGHLSFEYGTIHGLIHGWQQVGGLWHSAINVWGDTSDIKCLGYKLALEQKFWGTLTRHVPERARGKAGPGGIPPGLEGLWGPSGLIPHKVPMASHCAILAGRQEYLDKRGYHEGFRTYGGGEPYLDLKWWILGGEVWLEPRGLIRHATFNRGHWRKLPCAQKFSSPKWIRGKGLVREAEAGDELLSYGRKYKWTNEMLHHNFMLSAYTVGGYEWLQRLYAIYWDIRKGNQRYLRDLKQLRREALAVGQEDRNWIAARADCTLDELLERKPWES